MADTDAIGILVTDSDGRIQFQSGCVRDDAVRRAVVASSRSGESVQTPQQVVVGGRRFVVLERRSSLASVYFVHDSLDAARLDLEGGKAVGAVGQDGLDRPEPLRESSRELPAEDDELAHSLRVVSSRGGRRFRLEDIVGTSSAIRQLKSEIAKVAPLDVPVLLVGESGTGKELAAHAIEAMSPRQGSPMVLVNAAALPATLVESELFGYEPGAFTGAGRRARKGKFEAADGGTLFLDEIGDMPLEMQAKLLRVLQDGTFQRVGAERQRRSDFRLIAATNRDLIDAVETKRFRLDLYYRISGVIVHVPALRDRLDDVPLLVERFLRALAERHGGAPKRAGPEVIRHLQRRPWPGNVRQLLHDVQTAAAFAEGGELRVADFRHEGPAAPAPIPFRAGASAHAGQTISRAVAETERSLIREALARHAGNKKRVAAELGISRSHLYKRLQDGEGVTEPPSASASLRRR